jgi:hypothetical protein
MKMSITGQTRCFVVIVILYLSSAVNAQTRPDSIDLSLSEGSQEIVQIEPNANAIPAKLLKVADTDFCCCLAAGQCSVELGRNWQWILASSCKKVATCCDGVSQEDCK